MGNPFTDPATVGDLYADPARLTQRTSVLHAAKIAGPDVANTIVGMLARHVGPDTVIADVGCGRGSTTLRIARNLPLRRLIAFDASAGLLDTARARFAAAGLSAQFTVGDFHHLPFADASLDAVVAAFCLYHAPDPSRVVAEFARTLRPLGAALLVTKSADSYTDLDAIVAASGLDPDAGARPSLYSTFHSAGMTAVTEPHLTVVSLLHERHLFRFAGFDRLAAYLATTPRYRLGRLPAAQIARRLREHRPDQPVTTSSTVSYLIGVRR